MRKVIRVLLIASCGANLIGCAALLNVVQGRGGISYLKAVFKKDSTANVDVNAVNREKMFEALPAPNGRPIVFLGDSITSQCEWGELFRKRLVLNRGIGGDTSAGVLKRLPSITRLHPAAVFLMIGTNDRQLLGYEPSDTIRNYRRIVGALVESSPDVRIFAESILPSRSPKFNNWSAEANRGIARLADGRTVTFIDLRPAFLDENRLLRASYTYDGLHINDGGYLLWKQQIDPLIDRLD